jgi:hypothetical protein
MMSLDQKLRVGISLFARKGHQSLWENGIFQNCIFLAQLLKRSPRVSEVYLVVGGGGGDEADAMAFLKESPVPVINMDAAMHQLDLMVEMSAQLSKDWMIAFKETGRKVVSMRVGNDYVIDIERMVFDKPHGLLITGGPYDEVWTLPEYINTCVPYFASTFRAPVRTVPHLWSPELLEKAMREADGDSQFGYQPGRKRWRMGMFEPNVCMVKTSHIPMLVCEAAHRAQPNITERVQVYNTVHLKDDPVFNGFANSLDIVRHGVASFEGRFPIWQLLSKQTDAVISHQWENAQNYVYYEALYGGYPLVHNSHLIADCGYRYHGFDCEEGGKALCEAFAVHDENLEQYRARASQFLATLDPLAQSNVTAYTQVIEQLYQW